MKVNLIEIGGNGGVYQHAVAVGDALAEAGWEVRILTSRERELEPRLAATEDVLSWHRGQALRGGRIVLDYLFRTVPRALLSRGLVWVQGSFKPPLTAVLLAVLRLGGRKPIFSPHNLFSRYGKKFERVGNWLCLKLASVVVVYNESDRQKVGPKAVLLPLLQYSPIISPTDMAPWRSLCADADIRVASIGQIRADKNLDLLIDACSKAGFSLLIVGSGPKGLVEALREKARTSTTSVTIVDRYLQMAEIAAVAATVGLLALPYTISSQSGVAVLGRAYGARTIGYAKSGLADQVDVTVDSLGVADWANALLAQPDTRSLAGAAPPVRVDERSVLVVVEALSRIASGESSTRESTGAVGA